MAETGQVVDPRSPDAVGTEPDAEENPLARFLQAEKNPMAEVIRREEEPPILPPPGTPLPSMEERARTMEAAKQKHYDDYNKEMSDTLEKLHAGDKFDPQGEPIPGGVAFAVGRQMALAGDGMAHKTFTAMYPKGDLIRVPTSQGDALLYRANRDDPNEPWKPAGNVVWRGIGNVATMKNIGIGVGGLLGAEGGPLTAGGMSALGGMVGRMADYGVNRLAGIPDVSAGGRLGGETVRAGLEGGVPVMLAEGAFGAGNFFRNRALWALKGIAPELRSFNDDLVEEGLHPLSIGQASPNMMLRKIFKQSSSIAASPKLKLLVDQMNSARDALQRQVDAGGFEGTTPEALQRLTDLQRDRLATEIPVFKAAGRSPSGQDMQTALQDWDQTSRALLRRKGDAAVKASRNGELQFDATGMRDAAYEIQSGVYAPGRIPMDPETGEPLIDPVTDEPFEMRPTKVQQPSGEVQPYLDKLARVGDTLENVRNPESGRMDSGLEQLMAIRDGLYGIMTSEGSNAQARREAAQLWSETVKSMNNPVGGRINANQWRITDLLDSYKDFETTKKQLGGMLKAREPGALADNLIRSGNLKTLNAVKKALGEDSGEWQGIVDGYRSILLDDLPKAEARLDRLSNDPDVLDAVMPRSEQEAWRDVSRQHKRLDASLASKLGQGEQGQIANATQLAQTSPAGEINRIVASEGGRDGPTGVAIRTGMWNDILAGAKVMDPQNIKETLDPIKLAEGAEKYLTPERLEALQAVLRPADVKRLRTFALYGRTAGQDLGGSTGLGAAEQAKQFHTWLSYIEKPGSIMRIYLGAVNSLGVAKMLAKPVSGTMLDAAMRSEPTSVGLRNFAAAMGVAASDMERGDFPVSRPKPKGITRGGDVQYDVEGPATDLEAPKGGGSLESVEPSWLSSIGSAIRRYFMGDVQDTGPAPPMSDFTSPEEAKAGLKAGVDYGTGYENITREARIRNATGIRGDLDAMVTRLQKLKVKPTPEAADMVAQALVASRRNPVSGVGFDPHKLSLDTSGEKLNLGGFYDPESDQVWANKPSAIVHEMTHRGLHELLDSDLLTDKEKSFIKGNNESIVRYIMAKDMGDVEGATGTVAKRQRDYAMDITFGGNSGDNRTLLKGIEAKAARLWASRRTAGPH